MKIHIFSRELTETDDEFSTRFNNWLDLHKEIKVTDIKPVPNQRGSVSSLVIFWEYR